MSNNGNGAAKFSYEEFDLKHIFQVAEQILVKREPGHYGRSEGAGFFTGIMDQYGSTISDVSREMTCKLSESEEEKTCKILKGTLRNHSWKAKMVIAVAALALKCGKHLIIPSQLPDFENDHDIRLWSNNQPHKSGENSIIKSIWLIQRLHIITDDQIDKSRPLFKWLKGLEHFVQPMMNLARHILLQKLGDDQIYKDEIQWIIESAVVCSSQITVSHLLLLSNRENKLFEIHLLKLKDLTDTVKKKSKIWKTAQPDSGK